MRKAKTLARLLDFVFIPSSFIRTVRALEKEGRLKESVRTIKQAYSAAITGEAGRLMFYTAGLAGILNYLGYM